MNTAMAIRSLAIRDPMLIWTLLMIIWWWRAKIQGIRILRDMLISRTPIKPSTKAKDKVHIQNSRTNNFSRCWYRTSPTTQTTRYHSLSRPIEKAAIDHIRCLSKLINLRTNPGSTWRIMISIRCKWWIGMGSIGSRTTVVPINLALRSATDTRNTGKASCPQDR